MRASIVIAGSVAQKPGRGGHTWVFLQYLLGFRKLGWDVLFVDRLEPGMCVDEAGRQVAAAESLNVRYLADVMRRFGLDRDFSVLCDGGANTIGLTRERLIERVRSSAALINVMGFLNDDEILAAAHRRIFLDIDPGFGQMWQALGLRDIFHGHDAHVTLAENIGQPSCGIPTCGIEWTTTRQPVVLEQWPAIDIDTASRPITSVVSWRGAYGPLTYAGHTYGLRAREFRKFAALPQSCDGRFELALDIHAGDAADIDLLRAHRWSLVAPGDVAGDPWRYRDYVGQSAAELMIAKGMYVDTRSGWISDRSICYLASGRPVLAQDTGLAGLLPTGEGLLIFTTLDEATEAVRAVRREPDRHQRAARRLAEEYFDSTKVLGALAEKLGLH
jgi:Glycosyl transferases group 1